jgi:folate-binding protein YgfZ
MTTHEAPKPAALSPDDTTAALSTTAVTRWWQVTALLDVSGPDATTLLDGLCTQAVERIEPGTGVLGLFLDTKAKIIAPVVLHRTADANWTDPRSGTIVERAARLLLETTPDLIEPLRAHLSRYRLRSRVTIEPSDLSIISIVGSGLEQLELPNLADDGCWSRIEGLHRPTIAALTSASDCSRLVGDALPAIGIERADPDALESDRIDASVAGLHDLLPGRMPAEVGGMQHAVALDAGCYLGQEPVARLHYRGRANRTLRRIEIIDGERTFSIDDDLEHDERFALRRPTDAPDARAVGQLTTWARRSDGTTVALAILRRELEPGDELLHTGSEARAKVVDPAQTIES